MKRLIVVCMLVGIVVMAVDALAAAPQSARNPEPGFVSIFNGKDLTGWDGDPRLWSVKDGVIRGQTTEENPARGNTFCIWRDGKVENFILKIKFRIQNGNSGVQYRSKEVNKWVISGYQAEVQNAPGKVGFLYHERGRGWLVNVGDMMVIDEQGKLRIRDVEVARAGIEQAVIISGLVSGEKVCTSNLQYVTDGMPVRVEGGER